VLYLLIKAAVSGAIVAAVSEIARRYPGWGGLVASLPLTSLLALIWLYSDTGDAAQAADLARGIFWLVLPSLAFFVVFPAAVRAGWTFWASMGTGIAATLVAYGAMLGVDRAFGLKLFG